MPKKSAKSEENGKSEALLDVRPQDKRGSTVTYLSPDEIKTVKALQPRKSLGDLDPLKKSVKESGLLTSLVVRPSSKNGIFELVCGHRRLEVAKQLNLKEVPVQIRVDLSDDNDALAAAAAENSSDSRTDLAPIERAEVFAKLRDAKKISFQEIGRMCGYSGQTVRTSLDLLELPANVQQQVNDGKLPVTAATTLAAYDPKVQKRIIERVGADFPGVSSSTLKRVANEIVKEDQGDDAPRASDRKRGDKKEAAIVQQWRTRTEQREEAQAIVCRIQESVANGKKVDAFWEGAFAFAMWMMGEIEMVTPECRTSKRYKAALDRFIEMNQELLEQTADTEEAEGAAK